MSSGKREPDDERGERKKFEERLKEEENKRLDEEELEKLREKEPKLLGFESQLILKKTCHRILEKTTGNMFSELPKLNKSSFCLEKTVGISPKELEGILQNFPPTGTRNGMSFAFRQAGYDFKEGSTFKFFKKLLAGSTEPVNIRAPSGVGKTRLIDRLGLEGNLVILIDHYENNAGDHPVKWLVSQLEVFSNNRMWEITKEPGMVS